MYSGADVVLYGFQMRGLETISMSDATGGVLTVPGTSIQASSCQSQVSHRLDWPLNCPQAGLQAGLRSNQRSVNFSVHPRYMDPPRQELPRTASLKIARVESRRERSAGAPDEDILPTPA